MIILCAARIERLKVGRSRRSRTRCAQLRWKSVRCRTRIGAAALAYAHNDSGAPVLFIEGHCKVAPTPPKVGTCVGCLVKERASLSRDQHCGAGARERTRGRIPENTQCSGRRGLSCAAALDFTQHDRTEAGEWMCPSTTSAYQNLYVGRYTSTTRYSIQKKPKSDCAITQTGRKSCSPLGNSMSEVHTYQDSNAECDYMNHSSVLPKPLTRLQARHAKRSQGVHGYIRARPSS